MDVRIEKKEEFQLVGVSRRFQNETGYRDIPAWWDELNEKAKTDPAIRSLGQIAVCMDDNGRTGSADGGAPYLGSVHLHRSASRRDADRQYTDLCHLAAGKRAVGVGGKPDGGKLSSRRHERSGLQK